MKKIISVLLILIILASLGLFYLNRVFLPIKVKSAIIQGLEELTQKKVSLGIVKINIFKGLVLRDLKINDDSGQFLTLKEGSCGFFILPFKKQVIIPSIKLQSVVLFIKRNSDGTFNIAQPSILEPVEPKKAKKSDFRIVVSKVVLVDSKVNFEDNTFAPGYKKSLENIDGIVYLSLPAKVRYKLNFEIPSGVITKIKSLGVYNFNDKQLNADISILDLNPKDFNAYLPIDWNYLKSGSIDINAVIKFKDQLLNGKIAAQPKNFELSKNKILAKLNSRINMDFEYLINERKFNYSGQMSVLDARVEGIEVVDKIENIRGDVKFNKMGFSSENLTGAVLGLPVSAKINLPDYSNPILKAEANSDVDFSTLLPILKEKLGGNKFDAKIEGSGNLFLAYYLDFKEQANSKFNGRIGVSKGRISLANSNWLFENINGKIGFDLNSLDWTGLKFRLFNNDYVTSGKLDDFKLPKINFQLKGNDLDLNTELRINSKTLDISKLKGRYLNSDIELDGKMDLSDQKNIFVDLNTDSIINLKDIKTLVKKPNKALDILKPAGSVRVQANIEGNISDFKSCFLQSKLTSNSLSLYGLKTNNIAFDYNQENGIGQLTDLNMDFYGGLVKSNGKINFSSNNPPYWIEIFIQDVKIEKLKDDTGLKDKDISGTVQAQLKLNGFSNDASKLSGAGKINIKDGKLWELNLFKGFGSLLFTTDFTNVVFNEGRCSFEVMDEYISTENLVLRSTLADIIGIVKIGFDTSIDATLDIEVSPDVPLTGTLKDVTTAILGQAGRFGVIRVTGNFKEPKYNFKPAVMDIIKGFKDVFFPKD